MMKTKDIKKGISLIFLIITIIVVIILAAVVILTLSKNNPIESAKEARFKEDVRTFQDELAMTVSKQYTQAGGKRDEKITTFDFDEIQEHISSFSEKYRDKFCIMNDELRFYNLSDYERKICMGVNIKPPCTEVEYIESTGTQWIDTGVSGGSSSACVFIVASNNNTKAHPFLYGENLSKALQVYAYIYENQFDACVYNQGIQFTAVANQFYKFELTNDGKLYIDDVLKKDWKRFCGGYGNTSFRVFSLGGKAKVKYLKMEKDGKIEREFLPVLYKNEIPCLYDKIEGKFYFNKGSDEFLYK